MEKKKMLKTGMLTFENMANLREGEKKLEVAGLKYHSSNTFSLIGQESVTMIIGTEDDETLAAIGALINYVPDYQI